MFVPAISSLFWILVYSWPAEVVSITLDVAASPPDLQLLNKGPQIANVTSDPELHVTQAVNATTSEIFQTRGINYHVELSTPAINQTIAVETLQHLLQDQINEC